jgi:uncharacterized protein (DUF2147 family)
MFTKYLFTVCLFLGIHTAALATNITGYWQTIDKKTKLPTSVIAIYPYQGKYYGRIIATCNGQGKIEETMQHPKSRAPGVAGKPYYCGLDIIWINEASGKGQHKGHVMDPTNGKVYTAKVWREGNNLVLRGEVLMFGRNEIWPPCPDSYFSQNCPKPDMGKFVPLIRSKQKATR